MSRSAKDDTEVERTLFERRLAALEDRLAYRFVRKELLRQALTHSSFANENEKDSYERLEFLGDRVIELSVSDWLYRHRTWDEGRLSKVLAWLVDEESLAGAAKALELKELIRIGRSYSGAEPSASVLADSFEAVVGALYIDAGVEPAARIVVSYVLKDGDFGEPPEDYFSRGTLEERCRKFGIGAPTFSHRGDGPEHDKVFECTVSVESGERGVGIGRTKKEAERKASADLLRKLREGD